VHLVFDIFQGIGVAAAVGVRPFLPALAVGALAAGDVELNLSHCDFSFVDSPIFLLAMMLGVVLFATLERRTTVQGDGTRRAIASALAGCALVLGALLFAAALCRGHYAIWPGIVGGIVCAGVGIAATQPLLRRVRSRLEGDAVGMLPLIADGTATIGAVLAVLAPPVGIIILAALLWLLIAGRGRGEQKYAGLRILR